MTRILFVFVDGIGLGPAHAANPLSTTLLPSFGQLAGGHAWTTEAPHVTTPSHVFRPIDATLGIDGLPQSGTGQATLLTGVNCAALVGRHFGPFPHSATHEALASDNLFARIQRLDRRSAPAFANAYPPRFFDYARERRRWTVTTRCCLEANVPVRSLDALREGRALTADLTGAGWTPLGHNVPVITEAEAGSRFVTLARDYPLTLFEYFLTDKAGHRRIDQSPTSILQSLDHFFEAILERMDPRNELLLITSDHGNIEDGDRTTHTRHPIPLIAYGQGAHHFADATSLIDVTPRIVRALAGS